MMSQKINPTNLRLKKRLNWNLFISNYDFKNYSSLWYTTQNILSLTKIVLFNLNFYTNNDVIIKNSKKYNIFSRLFNNNQIYKNLKDLTTTTRFFYMKKQKKAIPKLNFNNRNILCEFTEKIMLSKLPFFLFSPKIISYYVIKQLNEPNKLKDKNFSKNLQLGLLKITNFFLYLFKDNINGLKILCSGKWRKTRTGRKQKLCLKFGKIQNTSVSNTIFFSWVSQNTKHGSFGIKIWISHKTK